MNLLNDTFNLFEGFSDEAKDDASVLSEGLLGKKPEKKEEKKTQKKTAKKAVGKLVKPVTVAGCGWKYVIEGEGEIAVTDVAKEAFEAGYEEVALAKLSTGGNNILYVNPFDASPTDDDEAVQFRDGKVTVVCGMQKAEYAPSDFGMEESDISVLDLTDKYIESHPEFGGALLCVKDGIAVPVFEDEVKDKQDTCKVWQDGKITAMTDPDFHLAFDPCEEGVSLKCYRSSEGVLFPVYSGAFVTVSSSDFGLKTIAKKTVEEKFQLPFTLVLPTLNKDVAVTKEHFEGRELVTKEDVLNLLKGSYKIYGQSNRQFDFYYDKRKSLLSVAVISGKKGRAVVIPFPTLFDVKNGVRVEKTKIGTFYGKLDREGEIRSVDFCFSLPKIPIRHLYDILSEFRKKEDVEMMVVLVYDWLKKCYTFHKPVQVVTPVSVHYDLRGICSLSEYPVMQIHSHNKGDAFWSDTDNDDECGIGLYGVVGNLGESPDILFRAGMNGVFKSLFVHDLFDMGGEAA